MLIVIKGVEKNVMLLGYHKGGENLCLQWRSNGEGKRQKTKAPVRALMGIRPKPTFSGGLLLSAAGFRALQATAF